MHNAYGHCAHGEGASPRQYGHDWQARTLLLPELSDRALHRFGSCVSCQISARKFVLAPRKALRLLTSK